MFIRRVASLGRLSLASWALGLVALGSQGCSSAGSGARPASAVQHPLLEDFPLPSGFSLVDKDSVGSKSGSIRVAKYEFKGRMEPGQVNRFYKDYLPTAGWTFRGESFDHGQYDMRFESEREDCDVRIRKSFYNTFIVVDLRPRSAGSAEQPARPPLKRPTP